MYVVQYPKPATCRACENGKFKPSAGFAACEDCPPHLTGFSGDLNRQCVCGVNWQPGAEQDEATGFPVECDLCRSNEYASLGGECECLPGSLRAPATADNQTRSSCVSAGRVREDTCVVNRRLPAFAIRLGQRTTEGRLLPDDDHPEHPRMASGFGGAPPASASRSPGGACFMGRLAVVAQERSSGAPLNSALNLSLQLCARDGSSLACHALEQNSARPEASRSVLSVFDVSDVESPGGRREQHRRGARCTSCDVPRAPPVLPRFVDAPAQPLVDENRSQLSVGRPMHLSPERVVAAKLRRELCGANASCAALARVAAPEDFGHGRFLRALLLSGAAAQERAQAEHAEQAAHAEQAELALWRRPWVFCPWRKSLFDGRESLEPGECSGSVERDAWLDAQQRPGACAEKLSDERSEYKAPVHFCLLNDDTDTLCKAMQRWREDIRVILCRASGACARTDFFYTPTTFDLSAQEFVFDSVRRFYTQDCERDCAAAEKNATGRTATDTAEAQLAQTAANAAARDRCASTSIQALYDAVAGARSIKRRIAVIWYHYYRVVFRVVQLLSAVVVNAVSDVVEYASDGKNSADFGGTVAKAAKQLADSCVGLVDSIGSLFEIANDAMMKLFMSRGIGGWLSSIIEWICEAVKWIINNIWAPVLCPVLQFYLEIQEMFIGAWQYIDNGLSLLGAEIPGMTEILGAMMRSNDMLQRSTYNCPGQKRTHSCKPSPIDRNASAEDVALSVATRCWGTYLTFFGDHQQLSCTAADTCREDRMQSKLTVCGACAAPSSDTLAFGCDEVTKLCTCGVRFRQDTLCSANEDCEVADSSCRLLNTDLQLSPTDISCSGCSSRQVCFHESPGAIGRCACSAGFGDSLHRCARDLGGPRANFFFLEFDRLCLWDSGSAASDMDVVEFRAAAIIPCIHLDPSAATCAYAIDLKINIVRGGRGASGRRLLGLEAPPEGGGVWSLDPLCRDALQSTQLAETRRACSQALRRSNDTIAVLGLSRALPPCTLCSLTDVARAAAQNPLAVLNLLVHAPAVLARHGPLAEGAAVLSAIAAGVRKSAKVLEADPRPLLFLGPDGAPRVSAHIAAEGILPAEIVRVIESAMRFVASGARGANASLRPARAANASLRPARDGDHGHVRRLLFFREIIDSVTEERAPAGEHPDPLIAAGLAEVFGHRYPGASAAATLERARAAAGAGSAGTSSDQLAPGLWSSAASADAAYKQPWPVFVRGPLFTSCAELAEVWRIAFRCAKGTFSGWRTLTTERSRLEGVPVGRLREAWPVLLRTNASSVPSAGLSFTPPGLDSATLFTARVVARVLQALGVGPLVAYDLYYSVARVLEDSLVCDYESVQTCSRRRVRLEHGIVVVGVYVLAVYAFFALFGLGLLVALLLAPLLVLCLLQLCYGYSWTCLPMLPVCLWSDVTSALAVVLPLSLAVPSQLKKTTDDCVGRIDASQEECYELLRNGFASVFDSSVREYATCYYEQDYPPEKCLLSCRDSPFLYTSAADVFSWLLVELGGVFVDAAREAAAYFGRIADTDDFVRRLTLREATLGRQVGSADVSAHRICALLNMHMLVPYLAIALVVLSYALALVVAAAASIFPVILLVCQLFAAVTTGDDREEAEDAEDAEDAADAEEAEDAADAVEDQDAPSERDDAVVEVRA